MSSKTYFLTHLNVYSTTDFQGVAKAFRDKSAMTNIRVINRTLISLS